MEMARASSSDSILSAITVDDLNAPPSFSSTPPTSIGDSASISSTSLQLDDTSATPAEPSTGRSRRVRTSVGTYNVKVLSGTAIHAPRKFRKDNDDTEARRRTISGDTLIGALASGNTSTESVQKEASRLVRDGIEALDLQWSVKGLYKSKSQTELSGGAEKSAKQIELERRRSTRSAGEKIESFTKKLTGVLGKRSRKQEDTVAGPKKAKRELRNLADTPEFAKIDTKPVVHEVWSKGKLVVAEPPRKKKKVEAPEPEKTRVEEAKSIEKKKKFGGKRAKTWLKKGLYAGQDPQVNRDWFKDDSLDMRKKMEDIAPYKPNGFMPLPMWHGQRLLQTGRDFKLPFDVCNPLPHGQPKPNEWQKTSRNRFVGNAGTLWRTSSLFDSFSSKCVCKPENGCDDNCQNRVMLYECDNENCGAGIERCTNRAFADLQERRKLGGPYRIGVEVIKTEDRGYGVRSNRCFGPHQIIVEYTGEIITEEECDRRMNEDYKDNDCYYLMSFDQSMIIDATKGSIARFINHSCMPNCRMVKWIVGGKPRMALFAGDNPIMSGEELTYDYNFDPFSAKNVQECRCGSDNCRGVLGPKPKDVKPAKEIVKEAIKAGVKASKRKFKELFGMDEEDDGDRSPKKRKMKEAKGVKRSASSASMKLVSGAAETIKKTVSSSLLNVRRTTGTKRVIKKTIKASALQAYGKSQKNASSRNSSLTIVATESNSLSTKGNASSLGKQSVRKYKAKGIRGNHKGSRDASAGTIRVVAGSEDDEE
ncbi:SET domain-containing protein [Mollisia scopiformis]|uniref:SET domain-containing protein n=1 Tax=Mollisia scopiformis TaxID=149040 RepID=A0A132B5X8_MOLSC|nr:SET domain-containing protein [Mollisia scopiformis]KUJ07399.1 SET domain-containing protein [Mollisia scopiformis]